ncbi:hypothetical protein ACOMHN_045134 [Nucella lapillus]
MFEFQDMPKRSKSCLGRKLKTADVVKKKRLLETPDHRQSRLDHNAGSTARARSEENPAQRQTRLDHNAGSTARARSEENPAQRQTRLDHNAGSTARARSEENPAQRQTRLDRKAGSTARARSEENPAQRQTRLDHNAGSTARARSEENPAQRQTRLDRKAGSTARARSEENPAQRQTRLDHNAGSTARARSEENPAQRQTRLDRNAASTSRGRSRETQEQRQARIEQDFDRHHARHVRQSACPVRIDWCMAALNYDSTIPYSKLKDVNIGQMSIVCKHCGALKFKKEPQGMCCSNGKVRLPPLPDPPEPLKGLLAGTSQDSTHFLENITAYNAAFQMTSFGCGERVVEPGFMPTFKVQGQVYHRLGSILPDVESSHSFLQIYFMGDSGQEALRRCTVAPGVRNNMVLGLQHMLHEHNAYVKVFKSALDKMALPNHRVVIHPDLAPSHQHPGRFNAPVVGDVAVIMMDGYQGSNRDIVLEERNSSIQRIKESHRSYDPLQYPVMFPYGEDGYHWSIPQFDPNKETAKKVSAVDFYAHRIMQRGGCFNNLLRYSKLFSQYVVDMYAKVEQERLSFFFTNQGRLRSATYTSLRDHVHQGDEHAANAEDIGRLIILPSSFTGGPRYMFERTQDAMTYVRKYGRPDLFVTFTANPSWMEITSELMPGQGSQDRHDITARVFNLKLNKLKELIMEGRVFGDVQCYMHTIEWQKRGLPHAHILLWMTEKLRPTEVDTFISAEIPDPEADAVLHQSVVKHMVHGPCGPLNPQSPCMKGGHCSKHFPKRFTKDTQTDKDGYPLYRRRKPGDGGKTAKIMRQGENMNVDNRWIVPYCPLLTKIFSAHINVEYCSSVKSIKYICKYINKGSDKAVFTLEDGSTVRDEVTAYQTGRYISTNEAIWRILSFPIHKRYPAVERLAVHTENDQRVVFNDSNFIQRGDQAPKTTLTAFFQLCQTDDFAKTLMYPDITHYYRWSDGRWIRRKRGKPVLGVERVFKDVTLGRVYSVDPRNIECYCVRLLLHNKRGPVSFKHLRTVNGQECATFQQACLLMGLLEDDSHWNDTLTEASISKSGAQLRDLFAIMIAVCGLSDPNQLWHNHKDGLCEDILMQIKRQNPDKDVDFSEEIYNSGLILLEEKVLSLEGKHLTDYAMPAPQRHQEPHIGRHMLRETSYSQNELDMFVSTNEPLLVPDQENAFHAVMDAIQEGNGGFFFLDAPGGTGKTFLINLLLAKVRKQGEIAIAVASSGIAATLLTGGRTAHSTFKLPMNLAQQDMPTCNLSKNTDEANVLKKTKLIVWDECTMAHKKALEAVNLSLQDIRDSPKIFGRVTLLLAGDFRQTLPIITGGTPADELSACLKSSHLWNGVSTLKLSTNMRARICQDSSSELFSEQLLQLGNGEIRSVDGLITFPEKFAVIVPEVQALKDSVYPDLHEKYHDHDWLSERAILAPRNDTVGIINNDLLMQLPADAETYTSHDSTVEENQSVHYPVEFLNSLEPPGMPSHIIKLKKGCPVMLLRNLDAPKLCNGTRLVITQLHKHVVEATIMTGEFKGEDVFIPRIPLIPSDVPLPFKRLQLPLKPCFAMSINKSQGQSLKVVGVNLKQPCFSHGQLYVACSRVGSSQNLHIYAPEGRTKNIVYKNALQ